MMLLLINVEFMIYSYDCCCVYVLVENPWNWLWEMWCLVKLLCFRDFCENGSKEEKNNFDDFEWIHGVVMMNWME